MIRHSLFVTAGILFGILTGCTRTVVTTCPAPKEYTEGQQAEAAEEVLALPPGSILTVMMLDYGELRAKNRACQ